MITALTGRGAGTDRAALVTTLVGAGLREGPPTNVTTTVLDTFDGRLHDAGLRLEQRGSALVLGGRDTVPAQVSVAAPPRFASDLPPGPFRARLSAILEVRALLPVLTLMACTRSMVRRNREGKIVASARVHERLTTDRGEVAGWFVEVDELTGYLKQSAELRDLVLASGVRPVEGDVIDVAMSAIGVDPAGHRGDPSVPLEPQVPALDGFRRVLANLGSSIDANLPGTVDDIDPEFLHDFRVAVRRTRSVLGHGKRVLPPRVLAWAGEDLRSLGQLTGPPRDLDVYVIEWDTYVQALPPDVIRSLQPVRDQLDADRAAAHRDLATALRSAPVTELLDRWRAWLAAPVDPTDGGPHASRPVVDVVRRRIGKAQGRLVGHGRAITPTTPAEQVHELRKDAKKLRYLFECFGGLLPGAERKAFVKRLKALQDNLGEHQDAEVHAAQLRETVTELPATTPAPTFVAIGQLIEQLEQRRQDARDEFAERFADYDSKATRQAFRAVLDGVSG